MRPRQGVLNHDGLDYIDSFNWTSYRYRFLTGQKVKKDLGYNKKIFISTKDMEMFIAAVTFIVTSYN